MSPDAESSSTSTPSTQGTTAAGDDVPAKFKEMATNCIQQTGKACSGNNAWLSMLPGQCASFSAWRFAQQWYGSLLSPDGSNLEKVVSEHPIPGVTGLALGNGNQVATTILSNHLGDPVRSLAETQPGDIVSTTSSNAAGHTYVILSNNNGDITIEDYNLSGGPGKYGTKDITGSTFYTQSHVVAIARVHRGGGST